MRTVALCMIVKNEEETLARAITPFLGRVEQIVVVDTGSTDRTKAVAASLGAEVYDSPWQDDFSAARNAAFSHSRCDYNLWIDADDVLTPENAEALSTLKENLNGATDAYFFRYHVAFCNGKPTFSYYRERLVKNDARHRFAGRVHEAISCQGTTAFSEIAICHYPKKEQKDPLRNLKIYRKMKAQSLPFTARDEYYYGRELYYCGKTVAAKRVLSAFLLRADGWVENKTEALVLLAQIAVQNGKGKEAKRYLLRTLESAPPRPEVCYDLATLFFEEENYRLAAYWYFRALTEPPSPFGFYNGIKSGLYAALQLTVCCDRLGSRSHAAAFYLLSEAYDCSHPSVAVNRSYFSLSSAQREEGYRLLQTLGISLPSGENRTNGEECPGKIFSNSISLKKVET